MEARRRTLPVALAVLALAAAAEGYNITKILAAYPEYSQFNKLLTQTRIASRARSSCGPPAPRPRQGYEDQSGRAGAGLVGSVGALTAVETSSSA